jgi:hypothetical protein
MPGLSLEWISLLNNVKRSNYSLSSLIILVSDPVVCEAIT